MNVLKCDECGALSDERLPYPEHRTWRTLSIRRAVKRKGEYGQEEWSPGFESVGHGVVREVDSWPSGDRWRDHWGRNPPLVVHLCSEECLLAGLKKLHAGARIVDFSGFHLAPEAMHACIRVSASLAEEAAAKREP